MTFKVIEKEFKHNDCDKLNKELDELLTDLYAQSEGLTDEFMDIVLDHSKQQEKEWNELYDEPVDWLKSILIKYQRDVIDSVIDSLDNIVYTVKPTRQPNMNAHDSREWLIDYVKPLILEGTTSQKEIAEKLKVNSRSGVMTLRVQRAYGCDWKEYVEKVQQGRY